MPLNVHRHALLPLPIFDQPNGIKLVEGVCIASVLGQRGRAPLNPCGFSAVIEISSIVPLPQMSQPLLLIGLHI